MNPSVLLALAVAYLFGSIPMGYLMGRLRGLDLREHGSGNIGATNAGRVLGRRVGLAVFAFDYLKGLLPALLLGRRLVATEAWRGAPDVIVLLLGVAAILGHVCPVWLGFKGGKGVATSAGACTALSWPAIVGALLVWAVVVKLTRYMSLASMVAAAAFPLAFVLVEGPAEAFGPRRVVTLVGVALAVAIVWLHRANVGRLLRGEEPRAGAARPKETR